MTTQRDIFWQTVYQNAILQLNLNTNNIVVVSADMGAPALDLFRKNLPNQYIDVGIAEQNAISVAAGLALEEKRPFVYAIAPFISLRCLEQIRLDVCAMKLPVTIVGVGAGFSYDDSGPTHHTVEDISALRSLSGLQIINVSDNQMAKLVAEHCCCNEIGPSYVRLDRKPFPDLYKLPDLYEIFRRGFGIFPPQQPNTNIKDILFIGTGNMTHMALEIKKNLEEDPLFRHKINIWVMDLFSTVFSKAQFLNEICNKDLIFTLEEHTLAGGMGSLVCETLQDEGELIPVVRFGLNFDHGYCYQYGGRDHLQALYGLNIERLVRKIKNQIEGRSNDFDF